MNPSGFVSCWSERKALESVQIIEHGYKFRRRFMLPSVIMLVGLSKEDKLLRVTSK